MDFQTIILFLFAAVILVGIAQKIHMSYPLALVLAGTVIGFIPGLPTINFNFNIILLIVLPPILYYSAFGISFREFNNNKKEIFSLALGLVCVTTFVIGVIFKWLFPEYPWALAFTFGAIVSPPDAVTASVILKRFEISNKLQTVLEGESLVNDATAIVLYKIGVVALLTGMFSPYEGLLTFLKVAAGGVAVGFILGHFLQNFSKHLLDPVVGVVFSFIIPYVTYIIADTLQVSGVLAVVVNGLIGSQILPTHQSSLRRIIGFATWDIFLILLNCFVFILIGLQLGTITQAMSASQLVHYTLYAVLITFAMIVVRMIWVYAKSAIAYAKALGKPKASTICREILRSAAVIGWSGMRGIVSLSAALALPLTFPDGMPVEGRNQVIYITFMIILLTLLIPGFTLSWIIRWLKIPREHGHHVKLNQIRQILTRIAEDKINDLCDEEKITENELDFLKAYFKLQKRMLENIHSENKNLQHLESIRLKVIHLQREKLVQMWSRHEIDDKEFAHLQQELDVEEIHIARAELT